MDYNSLSSPSPLSTEWGSQESEYSKLLNVGRQTSVFLMTSTHQEAPQNGVVLSEQTLQENSKGFRIFVL